MNQYSLFCCCCCCCCCCLIWHFSLISRRLKSVTIEWKWFPLERYRKRPSDGAVSESRAILYRSYLFIGCCQTSAPTDFNSTFQQLTSKEFFPYFPIGWDPSPWIDPVPIETQPSHWIRHHLTLTLTLTRWQFEPILAGFETHWIRIRWFVSVAGQEVAGRWQRCISSSSSSSSSVPVLSPIANCQYFQRRN